MCIIIVFDMVLNALLLFLRRISTVLSQGISYGTWLLAWEFLLFKSILHFAFLHLLSGYYYYDYVVIGVLRPSWFTEILFWIGLLVSKEVKQLKIIIIMSLSSFLTVSLSSFLTVSLPSFLTVSLSSFLTMSFSSFLTVSLSFFLTLSLSCFLTVSLSSFYWNVLWTLLITYFICQGLLNKSLSYSDGIYCGSYINFITEREEDFCIWH